ncbi:MAG: hypothetical protein KC591_15605, partial [Gemmatimonadetes bacterium]|nr:hypothetical protein [Gemmatimonadota bacterium]
LEGLVQDAPGETSAGVTALGDQTVLEIASSILDTFLGFAGPVRIDTPVSVSRFGVIEPTTIQGSDEITVTDTAEIAHSSSLFTTTLDGVTVNAANAVWTNGNVFLKNGAQLLAVQLFIAHLNTALLISDDGVGPPESLTVTGNLTVSQTASVPPRIATNYGFPNGARVDIQDGQGLSLERSGTLGGEVDLGVDAFIRYVQGYHYVEPTARIEGSGTARVDPLAEVHLDGVSALNAPVELRGTLSVEGSNQGAGAIRMDGGRIEGPGSLTAPVVVNPASPATAARFDGATVNLATGSKLGNGSLVLQNGAQARVPVDAVLVVDQTAFGLVIVDDGNGAQIEKVVVEGTLDVARTGLPAHRLQIPVEVTPTGLVIVQPAAALRTEKGGEIYGTLLVRENGQAAFQFATTFLRAGGVVRGNGKLTRLTNGDLNVGGTISPGESDGDIGHLRLEGPWALQPGSTTVLDATNTGEIDTIEVTQAGTLGGTLDVRFQAPLTTPNQTYDPYTSTSVTGTFDDVTTSGSNATTVQVVVGTGTVQLQCTTTAGTGTIGGYVYSDRNDSGDPDKMDLIPAGTTV